MRNAGSRRWRGDVSWLTSGLGGRLSAAHWRRYLYVAVTGATAKRSLYFFSSSPATCISICRLGRDSLMTPAAPRKTRVQSSCLAICLHISLSTASGSLTLSFMASQIPVPGPTGAGFSRRKGLGTRQTCCSSTVLSPSKVWKMSWSERHMPNLLTAA